MTDILTIKSAFDKVDAKTSVTLGREWEKGYQRERVGALSGTFRRKKPE